MSPSRSSLIEGFADVTLLFGLFPNNISVIGVGWFLGLIFAFYFIFPFFCVMVKNRKRAWVTFAVSLLLNYAGGSYFGLGRTNIVFCLCYLTAGALIYQYRNELEQFSRKYSPVVWGLTASAVILYFVVGENTITMLFVSVVLVILALKNHQGGVLQNRFTKFFSSVSMEIYLSHMVIFRLIERIGLNTIIGNGWLQYAVTVVTVLVGTIVFSVIMKKILETLGEKISGKTERGLL